MKISVLCNDGSPLGVSLKDLWGRGRRGIGVGGSEYALLTMCEQWHNEGHEVILYNNPLSGGDNLFEQRNLDRFNPDDAPDVLIVFRSPHPLASISKAKLKVWWSCDQYTIGSFKDFAPCMQKIVLISDYHKQYFADTYGITNVEVIDIPIRYQDFTRVEGIKKVPNRMIFNSVPDRGLHFLWFMWPIIKRDIPDATLHITSDYRLWGNAGPGNQVHKMKWMSYEGIKYYGAIPREQLLVEQAEAELLLYPSMYDTAELFCVSVAEAGAMGVYPITSDWGALKTTNMGTVIPGKPNDNKFREGFIERVKELCANPSLLAKERDRVTKQSEFRFHPEKISLEWQNKIWKHL